MNKKVVEYVNNLMKNNEFRGEIKIKLDQILEDKKIDLHDIPNILSLLVLLYKKYGKPINKKYIKDVFYLLLNEILKEMELKEIDNEIYEQVIESSLKLLMLSAKIKNNNLIPKCFK